MKKGFSLIELLTVIVVLGILIAITMPTIVDVIRNSRVNACEEHVRGIINAAKNYHTQVGSGIKNKSELNSGESLAGTIKLNTLKDEGFLEEEKLKSPIDDAPMGEYIVVVNFDFANNQFTYNLYEKYEDTEKVLFTCDV